VYVFDFMQPVSKNRIVADITFFACIFAKQRRKSSNKLIPLKTLHHCKNQYYVVILMSLYTYYLTRSE